MRDRRMSCALAAGLAAGALALQSCDEIPGSRGTPSEPTGATGRYNGVVFELGRGDGQDSGDDTVTGVSMVPITFASVSSSGSTVTAYCSISTGGGTISVAWRDAPPNFDPDGHTVTHVTTYSLSCHRQGAGS